MTTAPIGTSPTQSTGLSATHSDPEVKKADKGANGVQGQNGHEALDLAETVRFGLFFFSSLSLVRGRSPPSIWPLLLVPPLVFCFHLFKRSRSGRSVQASCRGALLDPLRIISVQRVADMNSDSRPSAPPTNGRDLPNVLVSRSK